MTARSRLRWPSGYDVLNYSESDNDHCEGLTAAEIASETLLNKLTAALTPEELAKGQAYFKSESLLTGDITLDSLLSMSGRRSTASAARSTAVITPSPA